MPFTVYKITSSATPKIYVGMTTQRLGNRWRTHRGDLKRLGHLPLYGDMKLYGTNLFSIEVIEECGSLDELKIREAFWIKELKTQIPHGYNVSSGDGATGVKRPDNAIRNRARCYGKPLSDEHCKKIGESHRGRVRPPGTGEKIAASKRGKKRSPEAIAAMSLGAKGKPWSLARRAAQELRSARVL